MLKMASRMAEQTAIKMAMYGKYALSDFSAISVNMKSEGKTPKLTTSARESSSLPMGELTFNARATKPSRKSNTQAAQTNAAIGNSPDPLKR
jgi:hypothetical protein